MQYIFYILVIPFLYFNYKIIVSDLKYKKIPNKYLGYLLLLIPFYYIYIYFSFPEINYLLFVWQIFLTFLISFVLYYFWIWAAGDAKYLLILSLFIPYIGIIPFIWNIALITIVYLIFYFIWFYLWKCLFYKWYAKSLWKQIKTDLNEKWKIYKKNKNYNTFLIILRWLLIFLLIFVSIRLSRIYLFDSFFEWWWGNYLYIQDFINKYNIYLIILLIALFIWLLYIIKLWIGKLKNYLSKRLNINLEIIWNIFLIILSLLLIVFIISEYLIDSQKMSHLLFLIFTLYLWIRILFKILLYSYKITFSIWEVNYINIKELKEWDIIDKEYLIKIFWSQIILWAEWENQNKKGILFPNPEKQIKNLENPIYKETVWLLNKVYKETNQFHKKQNIHFNDNTTIRILKTFSFAPYLLWWFIVTYFFQDNIFKYILSIVIETIKKLTIS